MEHDGKIGFRRYPELAREPFFLDVALGRVVVIIESDFAYRDAFRAFCEREKFIGRIAGKPLTVVGVNADREIHVVVRFGNRFALPRRFGIERHGDYIFKSVRRHIADYSIGVKTRIGKVRVRIDQHTSVPASASFSGVTRQSLSPSAAQSNIPRLSIPRILRGARLVTTTTLLPTISSGV